MSAMETTDVQDAVVERDATIYTLPAPAPAPKINRASATAFVQPPDIWSDDRPGLRKLWLYAAYGRWTRGDGVARFLGSAYAVFVALPFHAAVYLAAWIVERPGRLTVASVLTTLALLAF
jgi:hypothetical protein